jgi:hypothetical protein
MNNPARILHCPGCNSPAEFTYGMRGKWVRCKRCSHVFQLVLPSAEPLPAPRPPRTPRPTGSHFCPNPACGQKVILAPLGKRTVTFRHEECLSTITLSAAIYRCPICLDDNLLESPRHQWGHPVTCPVRSDHEFTVPDDLILRDNTDDRGGRFEFPCPSCEMELTCARRHREQWAVCPHCLLAIQVPLAGNAIESRPDLLKGFQLSCPNCGVHYPTTCRVCPRCNRG